MCFYIHKDYLKPIVAKKDITVYKVDYPFPGGFNSLYKNFKWERGYEYFEDSVNFEEKFEDDIGYAPKVNIGLHFYTTKEKATSNTSVWGNLRIFELTLPKGTRYWYNPHHKEGVTERLIFY